LSTITDEESLKKKVKNVLENLTKSSVHTVVNHPLISLKISGKLMDGNKVQFFVCVISIKVSVCTSMFFAL